MRTLVWGLAVTGIAVARAAVRHGDEVIAADDQLTQEGRSVASDLGITLHDAPSGDGLDRLLRSVDRVVPSPGVPETHRLITTAAALGVPVVSEFDLATQWEAERPGGPRPFVAITGTDGKTTTTTLAAAMLEASGVRTVAAGNTDVPLVEALELDVDAFVVECSSFRLRFSERFAPVAGTLLNLSPDHLNWHVSYPAYAAAKARLWEHQHGTDVAIGFADDAEVMRLLAGAPSRQVTFGSGPAGAHYRVDGGLLVGPLGTIAEVASLWRTFPHDLTNALAAAATVLEPGLATLEGVATALSEFRGVPHRIELVGEIGGVRFYDDSKATTPHAAIAAINAFDRVVLIAGGRNKDLDLRPMASMPERMEAVVAIGEAADEVAGAFASACDVLRAASMGDAVRRAFERAVDSGAAVLLSPGCASFDWYRNYAERGADFARSVSSLEETR